MALCTRRVMIVEEFSNKYKVRLLTCNDINEIYELERKNTLYYEFCPPFVTRQSILVSFFENPDKIFRSVFTHAYNVQGI